MRVYVAVLLLLLISMTGCGGEAPMTMDSFEPGQVWTYSTRPGEEASRVIVCRVEEDEKLGEIVHIHVDGVAMKNPGAADGVARTVGHMPFEGDALRASVDRVESVRDELPDFEEGYEAWKAAFENGEAGVFTISVAESIDFMEQTLAR